MAAPTETPSGSDSTDGVITLLDKLRAFPAFATLRTMLKEDTGLSDDNYEWALTGLVCALMLLYARTHKVP